MRRLEKKRRQPALHAQATSGLWPPRRRQHELVLLLGNQRPNFGGKGHEVRIAVDPGPKGAAVGIVIKLPDVNQLVQGPHIPREITHQFGRVLGQRRPALVFVQRDEFRHFPDDGVVGAQLINGHENLLVSGQPTVGGPKRLRCRQGDAVGSAAL